MRPPASACRRNGRGRDRSFLCMNMDGKTVLITGSTDGVGRSVAANLLRRREVLDSGRDRERAKPLPIRSRGRGQLESVFYQADRLPLPGRAAAWRSRASPTTTGSMSSSAMPESDRGTRARATDQCRFRARTAVCRQLPLRIPARSSLASVVEGSAPSRIVNVASLGQHPIDFDDVMITRKASGCTRYAQSKLAQIMSTIDLSQANSRDRA